ncbi:MAG TPA: ABC transporter permease [Anaerolineales bacterium]|nr:ABC transporter permease [Anaerolineales bacterium]
MNTFPSALYSESLKSFRSKVPLLTTLGFLIAPFIGGLFMIILKDPEAAKSMGLISTKAQLTAGVADWPTFFNLLAQATAIGGAMVFAILTTWVFGREFSDHTVKELLSLPTSREMIVTAKFTVIFCWTLFSTVLNFGVGMIIGNAVVIPGWSLQLFHSATIDILGSGLLTILLLPFVALMASIGRGFMPAFGWTVFTVVCAQIAAVMGWGGWFPWSVPALFSGAAGPRGELLGVYSYVIVILSSLTGLAATYYWWRNADQTR